MPVLRDTEEVQHRQCAAFTVGGEPAELHLRQTVGGYKVVRLGNPDSLGREQRSVSAAGRRKESVFGVFDGFRRDTLSVYCLNEESGATYERTVAFGAFAVQCGGSSDYEDLPYS